MLLCSQVAREEEVLVSLVAAILSRWLKGFGWRLSRLRGMLRTWSARVLTAAVILGAGVTCVKASYSRLMESTASRGRRLSVLIASGSGMSVTFVVPSTGAALLRTVRDLARVPTEGFGHGIRMAECRFSFEEVLSSPLPQEPILHPLNSSPTLVLILFVSHPRPRPRLYSHSHPS